MSGLWCGIVLALGIQSAECSMPATVPVPERRDSDPSIYAVPPAPPPVVQAPAPPPTPPPAPPAGTLQVPARITVDEGQAIGLPMRLNGSSVEIRSKVGDGIAINVDGAMADAGLPVNIDAGKIGGISIVGIRGGDFNLQVRALGPGGWSQPSSVAVKVVGKPVATSSPEPVADPEAERRKRLLALLQTLGADGVRARGPGHAEAPNDDTEEAGPPRDADYSRLKLSPDISGYPVARERMITTDRYISAVLEHRLNSQVPGRAVLVVDRPLYGNDGWKVLIESGSKVVCTYQPLEKEGNTRLPLKCERLLRPDGVSVVMRELVTGDAMASSGLPGQVDNRYFERYGAALIAASIAAIASVGKEAVQNPLLGNASQAYTNALGQATAKILEHNIDLAPIITIPAGTRITLQPLHDIVLAE